MSLITNVEPLKWDGSTLTRRTLGCKKTFLACGMMRKKTKKCQVSIIFWTVIKDNFVFPLFLSNLMFFKFKWWIFQVFYFSSWKKLTSAAAPGLRLRRTQKRYMRACISFRATGLRPSDYYCMKNIFKLFLDRWNVDIVNL